MLGHFDKNYQDSAYEGIKHIQGSWKQVKERDPICDLSKGSSLCVVLVGAGQPAKEGACGTIPPPAVLGLEHPTVRLEALRENQTTVACKTSSFAASQGNLD